MADMDSDRRQVGQSPALPFAGPSNRWGEALLLAVVIWVAMEAAGFFATTPVPATTFFPASGIIIGALLVRGAPMLLGVFVGVAAGTISNLFPASDDAVTMILAGGIANGVITSVGGWAAIWLLRRTGTPSWPFDRVADVFRSIGAAALAQGAIAAAQVLFACAVGWADWDLFLNYWAVTVLAQTVGIVVLAPATAMVLTPEAWARFRRPNALPEIAAAVSIAIGLALLFPIMNSTLGLFTPFCLVIPLLLVGVFRYGLPGSVLVSLTFAPSEIWDCVQEVAALGAKSPQTVLQTQAFVASIALFGLCLAAALRERDKAFTQMRRRKDDLEELVADRTLHMVERIKELRCLYSVSRLLGRGNQPLAEVLPAVVAAIPEGFRCPDRVCVRLSLNDGEIHTSPGFKAEGMCSAREILADGKVAGTITACTTVIDGTAFLPHEEALLDEIALRLGGAVAYQKLLEEEQNQRRTVEELIDAVPDCVWEMDAAGRFTFVSSKMNELLGLSQRQVVGLSIADIVALSEHSTNTQRLLNLLNDRVPIPAIDITAQTAGGRRILELSAVPVERGGSFRGWRGLLRDVTERREAEARQWHAQRAKSVDTLAGGIAHEFNNLLLPIIGMTEMTMHALPEQSRERERLAKVLFAAGRAKELIKVILAVSRPQPAERRECDLAAVVRNSLSLLRSTVPSRIRFEAEVDNVGIAYADTTQIDALIINLVTNAIDAIPHGSGTIRMRLARHVATADLARRMPAMVARQTYAQLVISDNGSGIDDTALSRIFDPFFSLKEVGRGTGLGLGMVHSVVEAHGGAISINSQLGEGTTVEVYLPLAAQDARGGLVSIGQAG